jgi:hypothetical protein
MQRLPLPSPRLRPALAHRSRGYPLPQEEGAPLSFPILEEP